MVRGSPHHDRPWVGDLQPPLRASPLAATSASGHTWEGDCIHNQQREGSVGQRISHHGWDQDGRRGLRVGALVEMCDGDAPPRGRVIDSLIRCSRSRIPHIPAQPSRPRVNPVASGVPSPPRCRCAPAPVAARPPAGRLAPIVIDRLFLATSVGATRPLPPGSTGPSRAAIDSVRPSRRGLPRACLAPTLAPRAHLGGVGASQWWQRWR